jgi:hypothetical protein
MNCMEFERDGVHRTAVESYYSRSAALCNNPANRLTRTWLPQV